MFKKRLGIILMLVCILTTTATEAFAAEVFSFEAVYAGSGQPVQPDPPKTKPASPKGEAPSPAEPSPEEIWVWAPEQPPEEPETTAQPVEPMKPAEPADPKEDFPYDLETFAVEVLRLTNEARAEAGAPALETDPVLTQMAQARMEESGGKLSHTRPDGTTPDTIFREYDTELTCTGEIIMSTSRSPQAIVNGFLASPSHRANLLDPNHKYAGIGVAWGETPAGPGIAVLELFAK